MDVVKDPDNTLTEFYLKDRTLAEDAVQETFMKAYKSLPHFRGDCSEKTWLTRILINTWNVICQGQIYPPSYIVEKLKRNGAVHTQ